MMRSGRHYPELTTRHAARVIALCLAAGACSEVPPETAPETAPDATPQSTPRERWCGDAEARLGRRVCVHEVTGVETWSQIAFNAAAVDQERSTTYLVPARDDARVPTVFVDASAFEAPEQSLHFKFLTESVVGLELLQYEEYLDLVQNPDGREWFSGSVIEFIVPGGDNVFGFTISDEGIDPAATITCEQFRHVYDIVAERISIGPVAVVPANDLQREMLASCDVPVHDPSVALDYEAYTQGKRCGTLKRYTIAELVAAELRAEFGWQDVLVTSEAPLDIQTVVAGIVTGTRQGELSHLNLRSTLRGTPNCYVQDAHELLARWEGQLVELECGPAGATVVAVTPEEAALCNEGKNPDPVVVAAPDLAWTELVPLLSVPTATIDERRAALTRFGSKGTNLATLYQRIDALLQLQGFLIPFRYYDEFMRNNSWSVDLGSGPEVLSFAETIARSLEDPVFLTDGVQRLERLAALQSAMQDATCDPTFVAAVETQILATYGRDDVMMRLRSSSNAEDAMNFNGAGLYDSASVCLADENDGDALGPSRCDPDEPEEREVCPGLKVVWASLWNMKAFEERSWFTIDHGQVAMGIVADTQTLGELANIVAFSGNPTLRGDRRFLINAQIGALDVVAAVPGVWPEKDLLTLENGLVTNIERSRGSTELQDGQWVLDDARLRDLGQHLATIVNVYPIDDQVQVFDRVFLDTEWKVQSDGQLVIEQVRPFLE